MNSDFILPGGGLKTTTVYNSTLNSYTVSIDVKKALPNKYKFLTSENFGITLCRVYANGSVPSSATRGPVIVGYTPDTGILTVSTGGDSLPMKQLTVKAWYT